FSAFAPDYAAEAPADDPSKRLPDGDLRTAYYAGLRRQNTEHVLPHELRRRIDNGERPVSAGFVTPYPPGFPVLVPGQIITAEVLDFMSALDTREIHGYESRLGYRVMLSKAGAERWEDARESPHPDRRSPHRRTARARGHRGSGGAARRDDGRAARVVHRALR